MKRQKDTVLRQLEYPKEIYMAVEESLLHENKRLGLATRSEKIHLNYYLTRLAQEGVDYRNGNVYVPSKMTLTKDQIDLLNDARKAVKAFNNAVNI